VPIRADRLWDSLMTLSEVGRYHDETTGLYGVNRLALTDADADGRRRVKGWMEEAGLDGQWASSSSQDIATDASPASHASANRSRSKLEL
jgi:hypothetical protein